MPPSARSPSIAVMVRWCCAASTSVGASSAAWPPASTAASMARRATTVLPEPTSPCSSRCIGTSRPSSSRDRRADLLLARGEGERQPRVEGLEQPARARRSRGRRLPRRRAPPLREGHLEDERLLVAQPPRAPSRPRPSCRGCGCRAGRRCATRSSAPGAHVGRQGVGHVVEHVEHPAHALGDRPGVQLADRAVDRDESPCGRRRRSRRASCSRGGSAGGRGCRCRPCPRRCPRASGTSAFSWPHALKKVMSMSCRPSVMTTLSIVPLRFCIGRVEALLTSATPTRNLPTSAVPRSASRVR